MLGERLGAKGFLGAAVILGSSLVTQVLGSESKSGGDEEEQQQGEAQLATQLVEVEHKQKQE